MSPHQYPSTDPDELPVADLEQRRGHWQVILTSHDYRTTVYRNVAKFRAVEYLNRLVDTGHATTH